jgi:hypothetical protein
MIPAETAYNKGGTTLKRYTEPPSAVGPQGNMAHDELH